MEQLAPAASVVPHVMSLPFIKNCATSGPDSDRLCIVNAWFPVLVMVIGRLRLLVFSGWLPKLMLVVESTANAPCPAPMSSSTCGFPGALSVKLTTASSGPVVDGTNPTSNEHWPPVGMVCPLQAPGPT